MEVIESEYDGTRSFAFTDDELKLLIRLLRVNATTLQEEEMATQMEDVLNGDE